MTLLLHPGFHKTATSWLQSTVFAERRLFRSLLTHEEADALLVRPHDFDFDPELARAKIDELRSDPSPGVVDVISSEILSGNILHGARDSRTLADRLFRTCGQAKVLFTVRAQKPITKSIYLQYIKRGGRLGIGDFLAFHAEPGYFWFDPLTLEFDRLVDAYAQLFGEGNVIVLPQELLARNPSTFLREMINFVGLAESDAEREFGRSTGSGFSPPVSGIPVLRLANAFSQTPFNPRRHTIMTPVGALLRRAGYSWRWGEKREAQRMKDIIDDKLTHDYRKSNARLQMYSPVDLASLGYEVDD